MERYKIFNVLDDSKLENSTLWIAEAEFGFAHLKEQISSLKSESNILEVGCGSGILLSMLTEKFSQHKFSGIEPFGDGYSQLKELNSVTQRMGVNFEIEGYEQHQPKSKYDFIYCVNVFEHVDDWRNFLCWAADNLNKGGVFFVLCPNYGFPYEAHFRIPIIVNKNLTYNIFKRYIHKFEQDNRSIGLWDSLNFVKKSEVRTFCNQKSSSLGFLMYDEITIIDDMVRRVSEDAEFRKRQSVVGKVATAMKTIGVFNLVKKFPYFLPYMKLSFEKR